MFSIQYPTILSNLGELDYGFQPVQLLKEHRFVLLIKATKEIILTARFNQQLKIYIVPDNKTTGGSLGFITAFFDDHDEPLVLFTPLYSGDALLDDLFSALSQSFFDLFFFDEHDREMMGVKASVDDVAQFRTSMDSTHFRAFNLDEVKSILQAMNDWFGTRTITDDCNAIKIQFDSLLYPDDMVIIDTRQEATAFHGGRGHAAFTSLERDEPGEFQERDIARMLMRVFPGESIYLNPVRIDTQKELTDIVCITEEYILIIQAKDSPNNEATLRRTIERKRAVIRSHIKKGAAQLKGTLTYTHQQERITIRTLDGESSLNIKGQRIIGLVIVREMFDDDYKDCSAPVLEVAAEVDLPCILIDYSSLHVMTLNLQSSTRFINGIRQLWLCALENGEFPKPRFIGPKINSVE